MDPPGWSAALAAPSSRWQWAGPLVLVAVLVGALPSLPWGVIDWDNEVKLQVARNLARGQGPVLTERTPDDATYVVHGRDGRVYSPYPLLASALQLVTLAAAPVIGGLHEGSGTLLVLALLGWAVVAWGRAAQVSILAAVSGALLVTLGTMLWPMAALGYDVVVEALALALILRAGTAEATGRRWALAGLAFGAALATRLGAAVVGFSAAVLLLAQHPRGLGPTARRSMTFALGAVPGVILVLWFNWLRFGSPLQFVQASVLGRVDQLASPWFSRVHLEGIAGLLVSPGKGLFWYSPPLLGVLLLAPLLVRRYGATIAALGVQLLASAFLFGAFRYWHGDWAWGPRYVAPLCVAAAPLAWWMVEALRERGRRLRLAAVAALLAAISIQALPVVGRPVEAHFTLMLPALVASHRVVTSPITRPPVPEDNRVVYFELKTSPFVSLARGLGGGLEDPRDPHQLAKHLTRAAVAPLAALLALAAIRWRTAGRLASPRGSAR